MRAVSTSMAAVAMLAAAMPAWATEDVECKARDNKAWMSFVVGTTPGLAPLGLSMGAGDKNWSTDKANGGTLIAVKQAFSDDDGMKIDVIADGKPAGILRVSIGHEEGQEPVLAGILHIHGVGAWPVVCGGEGEATEAE
jgi:hypothetical protein